MSSPPPLLCAAASAPGKLILCGEHAVVYGATAIAGALSDLRVYARAEIREDGAVTVSLPALDGSGVGFSVSWPLAEVRGALSAPLAAAAAAAASSSSPSLSPSSVLKPTLDITRGLDALTDAKCPGHYKKAVAPALFLAAAVCAGPLAASEAPSSASSASSASSSSPSARPLPGLAVAITSATLPVAAGLGSSAAVSVSLAAAILDVALRWAGQPGVLGAGREGREGAGALSSPARRPAEEALALINAWAYSSETLFHGAPSGLDNTVATYGGALAYTRSPATSSVSIEPVVGMPPLRLLVTNTRVPKETSKLVAGVRVLHDDLPAVVKPILQSVDSISAEVIAAIAEERASASASAASPSGAESAAAAAARPEVSARLHARLSSLLRVNHALLNALGVGHAALDEVVAASAKVGCVAKLTGAGGGGCALTLLPPRWVGGPPGGGALAAAEEEAAAARVRALVGELSGKGWDCFETQLGGDGVVVEEA